MTLCSPWIDRADIGDCGCVEAPNPEVVDDAIAAASEILYVLSGRQYSGLCDVIFRPCGNFCNCDYDVCGCNRLPRVFLDRSTVSVSSVDISGETLDPSAYRLERGWLLRLDGGSWPCCQDLSGEAGDPDTFSVTGLLGAEPTPLGIRAVKALATELVLACTPGEEEACALPARVTSVVKQGTSFTLLDPFEFLDAGKTGLYIVDLFLSVANPSGLSRPSRVWSPDLPYTQKQIVPTS